MALPKNASSFFKTVLHRIFFITSDRNPTQTNISKKKKKTLMWAQSWEVQEETNSAGRWWLMPVILAAQEEAIRRIKVGSQPGQIVCETLSL
jgi:hypothetical protein